MDVMVVKANKREIKGKRGAAKLRKAGTLPAVMYNSKGEAEMLCVSEAEFTKIWKNTTPTTLIRLDVDGRDEGIAFIKTTEYDIIKDRNLHVDFHVIDMRKPLKRRFKVQFTGNPVGVREGGKLSNHVSEVAVKCLPADLPPRIVADITNLSAGSTFRVKDLTLGKGIELLTDGETPLISVSPKA
ncbi:MAG: 50S ribosomal protein L25/general stress protein Ctc [Treponemataceae bacterium]|nr:MAG: 50S ribosomal protein L25/general stress protein Ctc [Treponemataceae bacterium]